MREKQVSEKRVDIDVIKQLLVTIGLSHSNSSRCAEILVVDHKVDSEVKFHRRVRNDIAGYSAILQLDDDDVELLEEYFQSLKRSQSPPPPFPPSSPAVSSLSSYQFNDSPSCLIELEQHQTGRFSSRGGILMGAYTLGQRRTEVVVKCHDKERDLEREVTILTKLSHGNDSRYWILYYYFHSIPPVENTYLVLERHGKALDEYLREITLSKNNKRSLVKELCHAVCALHEKGICFLRPYHRPPHPHRLAR